jgi:ABC-type proline/glycine betaine transport system permease subunit
MTNTLDFKNQLLQRLRVAFRTAVFLNWLVVLAILFTKGVPKPFAMGALTVFRATAVCATIWLLIEIAEALTKRSRALNPVIDAFLTLPMFAFLFLARASSL